MKKLLNILSVTFLLNGFIANASTELGEADVATPTDQEPAAIVSPEIGPLGLPIKATDECRLPPLEIFGCYFSLLKRLFISVNSSANPQSEGIIREVLRGMELIRPGAPKFGDIFQQKVYGEHKGLNFLFKCLNTLKDAEIAELILPIGVDLAQLDYSGLSKAAKQLMLSDLLIDFDERAMTMSIRLPYKPEARTKYYGDLYKTLKFSYAGRHFGAERIVKIGRFLTTGIGAIFWLPEASEAAVQGLFGENYITTNVVFTVIIYSLAVLLFVQFWNYIDSFIDLTIDTDNPHNRKKKRR